jgi:hypothetical protein
MIQLMHISKIVVIPFKIKIKFYHLIANDRCALCLRSNPKLLLNLRLVFMNTF